ncbi:MAG: ATP-dependent helicase HrpB, partial [Desulfobulbaceae bacterium]|nr:ATP-dependent helicase HrpB [Desulfobulbaceae bacterium]
TTVVPPALLNETWLAGQKIIMLEPRRLAARLAANFMAGQQGEQIGQTIGYRVRFDNKVGPATRIEVVTEGILTRRLQQDPELSGVGLVIFDEFHERSLPSDIALAFCLEIMEGLRDDLRILIMSATLDTSAISRILPEAAVIVGRGKSFAVSTEYLNHQQGAHDGNNPRLIAEQMAAAIRRALTEQEGDLLAFLPGTGEIRKTATLLQGQLPANLIALLPLYGDLTLSEQTRAVQPDPQGRRRVILATPIAESSVTIEGVSTVIDSGWRRTPRFDANSGLTRLTLSRISRASANQRTGRAGRLQPGHCYRLWNAATEHSLMAFDPPEILEADLAGLVLELARWGVREPSLLRWLDPPPVGHLAQARELLVSLNALDREGRITAMGKKMADLPLHPRLAHLLITAAEAGAARQGCDLAALLSERDIIKGRDRSADLELRLATLKAFRQKGPSAALAHDADPAACRRIDRAARQLLQLISPPKGPEKNLPPGGLLFTAFPDRVARQRPGSREFYKLANGRGARLAGHDPLTGCEYLAIAELDAGRRDGHIFLAAPLSKQDLLGSNSPLLSDKEEIAWDEQSSTVTAQKLRRYGELIIEAAPLASPDPEKTAAAMLDGIRRLGLDCLPWTDKARELQARIICLGLWQPEAGWPELSDGRLLATLEGWLRPYLGKIRSREQLKKLDLVTILSAMLDWQLLKKLEQNAPTHLVAPSGSRIRLQYSPGEPPIMAVRLQEMFGLAETPKICDNRVEVVLHLLSPARRPIQITRDLKGFWQGSYHEVKKELKGRYPKHHWPDDPWQAVPTARIKRKN